MAKSRKIIVFTQGLPSSGGGVTVNIDYLYNYLKSKGFEIVFIFKSDKKDRYYFDGQLVIEHPFPPISSNPFSFKFWLNKIRFLQLRKIVLDLKNDNQNDTINIGAHFAPDFIILNYFSSFREIKTFFFFEGPYHLKKFEDLKDKLFCSYLKSSITLEKYFFVSEILRSEFIKKNLNKKDCCFYIPNAVPVDAKLKAIEKKPNSFIIMARLVENKNIKQIINAFLILKQENISFTCDIYGHGPMYQEISDLINELELNNYLSLKGYEKDIYNILPNYEFFVSASLFEGMPLSPLEAMSNGVIPLLSDIQSHRAILPEKYFKLLFTIGNIQELKSMIKENIVSNRKLETIKNLHKHVYLNHNMEKRLDILGRHFIN